MVSQPIIDSYDITPVDVIRTSNGGLKVIRYCDIVLFKLGLAPDPYDC